MFAHFYRHRQKYIGVLYCIIAQAVIGIGVLATISAQYELMMNEESTAIAYTGTIVYTGDTIEEVTTSGGFVRTYSGFFGSMVTEQKVTDGTSFDHAYALVHRLALRPEAFERYYIAQYYFDQDMIDGYMFLFLLNDTTAGLNAIISDWSMMYATLGKSAQWDVPQSVTDKIAQSQALLATHHYDRIYDHVTTLQKTMDTVFATYRTQKIFADFMSTPEFVYLYDKISADPYGMYGKHIDHFSQMFGIQPALIQSAILTEQLRGFFTNRGMIKNLIRSQKYMMVMQHMSRGIGGVKEKTAIQAEQFVRQYRPELWQSTFSYLDTTKNASTARFAALTDIENYSYQIAYVASIFGMYQDERKRAGIDISQSPGVLLTLYNIGGRTPRANPEIGGANLSIGGQRFTFGELGLILYYFLQVYPK